MRVGSQGAPTEGRGAPATLPSVVASVALPALLIAGLGWLLVAPGDRDRSPRVAEIEQRLAADDAEIIILGASLTHDVDRTDLAAATGRRVSWVGMNGSTAPLWFVALKNRVFANGHRPRLVIVPSALRHMLRTTIEGETQEQHLREHADDVEPVLEAKLRGTRSRSPAVARAADRRERYREAAVEAWKGLVVGLWARGGGSVAERGRARIDAAHAAVFPEGFGLDARARVIPVVEERRAGPRAQALDGGSLEATFLSELASLAGAHGAKIVFVRVPFPSFTKMPDHASPELLAEVHQTLAAHGAALVDLSTVAIEDRYFTDHAHLGRQGSRILTERLVAELERIGALGDGALAGLATAPALSRAVRTGSPPPLPPLGAPRPDTRGECTRSYATPSLRHIGYSALQKHGIAGASPIALVGDGGALPSVPRPAAIFKGCDPAQFHPGPAILFRSRAGAAETTHALAWSGPEARTESGEVVYWLLPGTTLRFEVDDPWDRPMDVFALGEAFSPEGGAAVRLASGGAEVELARTGSLVLGRVRPATHAAPWAAELHSPMDGPIVAIRAIAVGDGPEPDFLFGAEAARQAAPVRLIGDARDGVEVRAPDHEPPAPNAALAATGSRSGTFTVRKGVGRPDQQCSPYRVARGGVELALPQRRCAALDDGGPGFCHSGREVRFVLSGDDPPLDAAPVALALARDRTCQRPVTPFYWLYPEDRTVFTGPLPAAAAQGERFEFAGRAWGPAEVDLRVEADGTVLYEGRIESSALDGTRRVVALTTPIPEGAETLSMITTTRGGFALLELAGPTARTPLERVRDSQDSVAAGD